MDWGRDKQGWESDWSVGRIIDSGTSDGQGHQVGEVSWDALNFLVSGNRFKLKMRDCGQDKDTLG